jgi:membrane protein DedA with SNARE-associated domain
VTEWVQDVLVQGSYPLLTALLVLENLFPPIPSEVVLPFAGALVERGTMGFAGAVLAATVGSLVGALVLYAVGRYGGRPLLYRYERVFRLTDEQLDRADAWFDQRGWWIVLFGRLIPGVRSIVSIPAGASEMPIGMFVGLTTLGSLAWNVALIGTGWMLGSNWEDASAFVARYQTVVVALVALAVVAGALLLLRRRRRVRSAAS